MNRPWQIWGVSGACVVAVAAAVGWLSAKALSLEQTERAAREQSALEENVRLALWRLDSVMAPFVALESARPWQDYQAAPEAGKAPDAVAAPAPPVSSVVTRPAWQVALYFQIDTRGTWSSPQAPEGPARDRVLAVLGSSEQLDAWALRFRQLIGRSNVQDLLSVSPELMTRMQEPVLPVANLPVFNNTGGLQIEQPQQKRGASEFNARSQYVQNNTLAVNGGNYQQLAVVQEETVRVGNLTPVVSRGELFLVRPVAVGSRLLVQGCWLDWPVLQQELFGAISDLLPNAVLSIAAADPAADQGRLLASLPVRIEPGPLPIPKARGLSLVQLALWVAWGAMAVAALAVGVMLRGVIVLSERRADFVSAVTHELRTPLTTFRLYSEMLAEGLVTEEAARRRYLDTLRSEADRLAHLVENVLAYARLEKRGLGNRIQQISGKTLLAAATERLAPRAAAAGLEFTLHATAEAEAATVQADPSAVEQILFNLVDNACKYAAAGTVRALELTAAVRGTRCMLTLRDHGPGLPADLRARLFQPFRKSADDAAATAPGVGLGLHLSRRLARDMGGDLTLDPSVTSGAAFALTLRCVR